MWKCCLSQMFPLLLTKSLVLSVRVALSLMQMGSGTQSKSGFTLFPWHEVGAAPGQLKKAHSESSDCGIYPQCTCICSPYRLKFEWDRKHKHSLPSLILHTCPLSLLLQCPWTRGKKNTIKHPSFLCPKLRDSRHGTEMVTCSKASLIFRSDQDPHIS